MLWALPSNSAIYSHRLVTGPYATIFILQPCCEMWSFTFTSAHLHGLVLRADKVCTAAEVTTDFHLYLHFLYTPLCCGAKHTFDNITSLHEMCLLQAGDKLPSVELYENNPTIKVNLSDITKGKKVVIFAVPGAFTPGCSKVSGFSSCCISWFLAGP